MTKAILLLPFRNEARWLPTLLSSVDGIVDAIVAIDNGSDDDSQNILKAFRGCPVFIEWIAPEEKWGVDKLRQRLLEKGREVGARIGADVFLCLDGDECVTDNFRKVARKVWGSLEKGQRVTMQWLLMWKSTDHYRDDNSVWSNNFKDFIFRDSDGLSFKQAYLCESRTPVTDETKTLTLNPKWGAVCHFQASDFFAFQAKQFWYRCKERLEGRSPDAINQKYRITLDDNEARVSALVGDSFNRSELPKIRYWRDDLDNWHLKDIERMIKVYGSELVKGLDCGIAERLASIVDRVEAEKVR